MYGAYSTTTRAGKQAQSDAFCGMDSYGFLARACNTSAKKLSNTAHEHNIPNH